MEKPDDELTVAELATLIRQLRAEIAPVEKRLRKLIRLHASKVANRASGKKRGAKAASRDARIREEVARLREQEGKGITANVAAKFKVDRRTVQRALRKSV